MDKCEKNIKVDKHSFYDNYIMDIFLFIAAIPSMIATAAIVHIVYKHAKPKALLTGIAFQPIRGTEEIFSSIIHSENCTCKVQWCTIAALALMIIGLVFLFWQPQENAEYSEDTCSLRQ